MDYFEEASSKLKKAGIASICIALAIITMINSCSIVQQRERDARSAICAAYSSRRNREYSSSSAERKIVR